MRDDRAFADLHRLVSDALFAYANAMLRDRKTAEDVVQQAFLELVRAAPTLRGDEMKKGLPGGKGKENGGKGRERKEKSKREGERERRGE